MKKLRLIAIFTTIICLLSACQTSEPSYQDFFYSPLDQSDSEIQLVLETCDNQAEIAARIKFSHISDLPKLELVDDMTGRYYRWRYPNLRFANDIYNEMWQEVKTQCMIEQGFELVSVCVSNCSE